MVLDVGDDPARVVDLHVGRAVPVGLRRRQAGLARVVGEHPPRRVGDGEGEATARPQHTGHLGDRHVDVADELQGAEGAEDDVEAAGREGQGGGGAAHGRHGDARLLVEPQRVLQLAVGQVEPEAPAAVGAHPARALAGAAADLEDVEAGRRHRGSPARPRCGPRAPTRSRRRRGTPRAWPGTRRRSGPSRARWRCATRARRRGAARPVRTAAGDPPRPERTSRPWGHGHGAPWHHARR